MTGLLNPKSLKKKKNWPFFFCTSSRSAAGATQRVCSSAIKAGFYFFLSQISSWVERRVKKERACLKLPKVRGSTKKNKLLRTSVVARVSVGYGVTRATGEGPVAVTVGVVCVCVCV